MRLVRIITQLSRHVESCSPLPGVSMAHDDITLGHAWCRIGWGVPCPHRQGVDMQTVARLAKSAVLGEWPHPSGKDRSMRTCSRPKNGRDAWHTTTSHWAATSIPAVFSQRKNAAGGFTGCVNFRDVNARQGSSQGVSASGRAGALRGLPAGLSETFTAPSPVGSFLFTLAPTCLIWPGLLVGPFFFPSETVFVR